MKAVVANDYGPPEQFTVADLPVPEAGVGQIRVRVAAASINPGDVVVPGGDFRAMAPLEFPHVPGNDFAGTVVAAGPGVSAFAVGEEIFGLALPRALRAMAGAARPSLGTGALAEYVVVEADTPMLAHRPPSVPVEQAAALPTVGLTALAVLATAQIRPGEKVLMVGATGGVGSTLVPLLAAAGATVIATGPKADEAALRALGAAEVIGYAEAGYPTAVDAAINAAVPSDHLDAIARSVRPGGRLVTITYPIPQQDTIGVGVHLHFVLDMEGKLADMAAVADANGIGVGVGMTATIAGRYPLTAGPQACVDFARRHTFGKLVVTP